MSRPDDTSPRGGDGGSRGPGVTAPPPPMGRRISRAYEEELATVRRRILLMGARIQEMIAEAVRAFAERDPERARRTIALDRDVNRDEIEIDAFCLEILARRQPLAGDLRFLTLALKMVTDLERIGDLAVNVCERTLDLARTEPFFSLDRVTELGTVVAAMVREAIESFVERDSAKARAVVGMDDQADALYSQIFRLVLDAMVRDATVVERGIHVQSAAKFLERIADHATNVAEDVVFLVEGRDIRHPGKLEAASKSSRSPVGNPAAAEDEA